MTSAATQWLHAIGLVGASLWLERGNAELEALILDGAIEGQIPDQFQERLPTSVCHYTLHFHCH